MEIHIRAGFHKARLGYSEISEIIHVDLWSSKLHVLNEDQGMTIRLAGFQLYCRRFGR